MKSRLNTIAAIAALASLPAHFETMARLSMRRTRVIPDATPEEDWKYQGKTVNRSKEAARRVRQAQRARSAAS